MSRSISTVVLPGMPPPPPIKNLPFGTSTNSMPRLFLNFGGNGAGDWSSLAGVVVGLSSAAVLGRVVRAQLYGVASNDIVSMALATTLLIAVALVAAWVPARRAAGYDPVRVLRTE